MSRIQYPLYIPWRTLYTSLIPLVSWVSSSRCSRTLTFEGADSLHRGVVFTSAFKVLIPFSIAIVFEVLIPLLSYPSSLFEILSPLRSRFPPLGAIDFEVLLFSRYWFLLEPLTFKSWLPLWGARSMSWFPLQSPLTPRSWFPPRDGLLSRSLSFSLFRCLPTVSLSV